MAVDYRAEHLDALAPAAKDAALTPRFILRQATSDAHSRVDRLFSGLRLDRPADYRLFLLAQADAFAPVEAALEAAGVEAVIDDWPARRRAPALAADLDRLGETLSGSVAGLDLDDPARILGAAYVLEGSRLGGAVLIRDLPNDWPTQFLKGPAAPSWRRLTGILDARLSSPQSVDAAVDAARDVFDLFERAARDRLGAGSH